MIALLKSDRFGMEMLVGKLEVLEKIVLLKSDRFGMEITEQEVEKLLKMALVKIRPFRYGNILCCIFLMHSSFR